MFVADTINLREILMKEPLPLVTIQNAVIDFLRGRQDVAVFGAQAVNVYVDQPRATEDLDLMSPRAAELAEELREHLGDLFHIAVRVREVKRGAGYRVFQIRRTGNRHLVDIRSVEALPQTRVIDGVPVLSPPELIAAKVISHCQRRGRPKSWTDRRDLTVLLMAFPDLKAEPGPVGDSLRRAGAGPESLALWQELVEQEIAAEDEEGDFQ